MPTKILLIAAFICFLFAALAPPSKINAGWLGMACWIASLLF